MTRRSAHSIAILLSLAASVGVHSAVLLAQPPVEKPAATKPAKYETLALRGRVVWLAEALSRKYGIRSVPEAAERGLALETPAGVLHPLAEDVRGRAFRADKRLRGIDLELVVRRYEGSPLVQVLQVYSFKKTGKYEVDYWCEICSIAMYELKDCECCQGPIEFRERLVESPKKR